MGRIRSSGWIRTNQQRRRSMRRNRRIWRVWRCQYCRRWEVEEEWMEWAEWVECPTWEAWEVCQTWAEQQVARLPRRSLLVVPQSRRSTELVYELNLSIHCLNESPDKSKPLTCNT